MMKSKTEIIESYLQCVMDIATEQDQIMYYYKPTNMLGFWDSNRGLPNNSVRVFTMEELKTKVNNNTEFNTNPFNKKLVFNYCSKLSLDEIDELLTVPNLIQTVHYSDIYYYIVEIKDPLLLMKVMKSPINASNILKDTATGIIKKVKELLHDESSDYLVDYFKQNKENLTEGAQYNLTQALIKQYKNPHELMKFTFIKNMAYHLNPDNNLFIKNDEISFSCKIDCCSIKTPINNAKKLGDIKTALEALLKTLEDNPMTGINFINYQHIMKKNDYKFTHVYMETKSKSLMNETIFEDLIIQWSHKMAIGKFDEKEFSQKFILAQKLNQELSNSNITQNKKVKI